MSKKINFILTTHAKRVVKERKISFEWIEQVLSHPQKSEEDKMDGKLRHFLGEISEFDSRVLRVIVNNKVEPMIIITVYFDRAMRGKI